MNGLLEKITKADNTTSTYTYDLAGHMTDVVYSDGTKINYGYNEVDSTTRSAGKDHYKRLLRFAETAHLK